MIKIIYTDSSISVTGHANFVISGKDIVCAGVSAIILGALK
ncbi:MAG: ribosomal-processing cysteine protease Prp [Mycoplasmoidaceae bacterium]|nr:ribosomal-processing cysteine protease Prp [Mycoplasmoidaceae bacterium]